MAVAEVALERLKKVPLARLLDERRVQDLLPRVQEIVLHPGTVMVDPGQPDCLLYYVEEGRTAVEEVDPSGHKAVQRQVGQGGYLGIYSLVTGQPCQINATAIAQTILLSIPVCQLHPHLLPGVQTLSLQVGETLYRQGDPAEFLYFVEEGRVAEVEQDRSGRRIVRRHAGPGEYLGRYALVTGRPLRVSAIVEAGARLLAIPLRYLQPLLFAHEDWQSWFFRTDIAPRLRAVPLLIGFDDWDIYRLADSVMVEQHAAGATIFEAGDDADSFYIVDQGQVIETGPPGGQAQADWPQYFGPGNFFGRTGLLHGERRKATAVARLPTKLFRIPAQVLSELLVDRAQDLPRELARIDLRARLREIPLFSRLADQHLRLLTGYVCLESHRPGDIVARQGEPASSLMILEQGEAVVRRQIGKGQPRPVAYFKVYQDGAPPSTAPGRSELNYFGDHALLADEMRGATVEVTRPSVWIVLYREDLARFLADAGLKMDDLKRALQPEDREGRPVPASEDGLPLPHFVRRHWIVLAGRILPLALFMVVVLVLITADVMSNLPPGLRIVLMVGGAFVAGLLAFWIIYRYLDWWNDTYEVTTEAVIHTEKKPFLSEQKYEIPLPQIQNVNIFVSVLGRLMDFGNVAIDTAAARGQIRFTVIPGPAYVQDLIQKAAAQARSGSQIQQRESIRQQLEDHLYPERLKPSTPNSVVSQPEPPPPSPIRYARFRSLGGWLPRFEIREDDMVIWRKHWINLLMRTGIQGLALLVALYLLFAFTLAYVTEVVGLGALELPPVSLSGFEGWLFLVMAVLGILAFLWFIYQYVEWRNDIYIVTDNEVIDVERQLAIFPLFMFYTELRRQASLANVQYVDFQIPHPLAMILNYGNVIVQTAGLEGRLDFLFVSNPRRVHDEILRRLGAYQERQREREFQERWGDMPQWFDTYQDLLDQSGSPGA